MQPAQVERFLHHALANKRRVPMDQQAHHLFMGPVSRPVLLGPHATQDHRVDELEMARVKTERQMDARAARCPVVAAVTHVILHVAPTEEQGGILVLELAEDLARTLADHIGQHVQPAAVRHAQHDLADSLLRRPLDRQVQERDQALAALERKALRAQKLLAHELLEDHRFGQAREDPALLFAGQRFPVRRPSMRSWTQCRIRRSSMCMYWNPIDPQ
jgi:hypothetical protein